MQGLDVPRLPGDDQDGYEPPADEPPADESVQEIVDADEIFRRLVASSPKELMD